jgi:amidase
MDGRQKGAKAEPYTEALKVSVSGCRIGIVREGFDHPNSEREVAAKVRAAAERFRKLGANVDDVSVPLHPAGAAMFTPIAAEGCTRQMMLDNGFGQNQQGLALLDLRDANAARQARTGELPDTLKLFLLVGQYGLGRYKGRYYAKCANLRRQLRFAYDEALVRYDLLLMPTTPMVATPLPAAKASRAEIIQRALEMLGNTPQFDLTGHPAMSLPCGMSRDLPVGMMLVGRHYAESMIYRAAAAFESSGDWRKM